MKASRETLGIYMASALIAGVVLMIGEKDMFGIMSVLFTFIIFLREIPAFLAYRRKISFYPEMMAYCSMVRKKFRKTGNIPEAVTEAAYGLAINIRKNAEEMGRILLAENRRKKVREYVSDGQRNRYLKLFLVQAYETSEYGDHTTRNGDSMFSENMEMLRVEMIKEMYDLKKRRFVFSGYMTVAVVPVILYSLVKKTGMGISGKMAGFYEDTGKSVLLFAFLCAFFIYRLISDTGAVNGRKTRSERLGKTRIRALPKDTLFIKAIRRLMPDESDNTVYKMINTIIGAGLGMLIAGALSGVGHITHGIAVLSVLTPVAGIFPIIIYLCQKNIKKEEITDEIKSLETVIIMESKMAGVTLNSLLEDMELFSSVFTSEIRECLNGLQAGMNEAILSLKEKGEKKHKEFAPIAEGLMAVDEVGIAAAFEDMMSSRTFIQKMEEIEDMVSIEKKRNILDVISWIPAVIIMFGYFIVPFLSVTYSEMEGMFDMLRGF